MYAYALNHWVIRRVFLAAYTSVPCMAWVTDRDPPVPSGHPGASLLRYLSSLWPSGGSTYLRLLGGDSLLGPPHSPVASAD